MIPCKECEGSGCIWTPETMSFLQEDGSEGLLTYEELNTCTECKGTGYETESVNYRIEICPSCQGHGEDVYEYYDQFYEVVCTYEILCCVCGGKGAIEVEILPLCPGCDGQGIINWAGCACPICEGKGR